MRYVHIRYVARGKSILQPHEILAELEILMHAYDGLLVQEDFSVVLQAAQVGFIFIIIYMCSLIFIMNKHAICFLSYIYWIIYLPILYQRSDSGYRTF